MQTSICKKNEPPAECFRSCVFHAVNGHVEVKACDYNAVLSLDPRAMWLKQCMLISRYITTLTEKYPGGKVPVISQSFEGRKAVAIAMKIKPGLMKELAQDLKTVKELEAGVKQLIARYTVTDPHQDKVMSARVNMFSNIGKVAFKVVSTLEQANVKSMACTKAPLTASARHELARTAMKDQLHEVEAKYRSSLMIAAGCSDGDMPKLVYPKARGSSGIQYFFKLMLIC
jgi:hypothetical protein